MCSISKKFIVGILLVLALVAGGFLWYASLWEKQAQMEQERNEQEASLMENSDLNQDTFNKEKESSEDGILRRSYPITDGKTYRITPVRQYGCEKELYIAANAQEMLEVNVDGNWMEVYRTKERSKDDTHCVDVFKIRESSIKLSPMKDYVEFGIGAWERGVSFLVNTTTQKKVVDGSNKSIINMADLIWSENARNYMFKSVYNAMSGEGRDAVYVSQYNNPDNPVAIFNVQDWAQGDKTSPYTYELKNLRFVDNETVEFSIFSTDRPFDSNPPIEELARYRYDLQKEKIKEVTVIDAVSLNLYGLRVGVQNSISIDTKQWLTQKSDTIDFSFLYPKGAKIIDEGGCYRIEYGLGFVIFLLPNDTDMRCGARTGVGVLPDNVDVTEYLTIQGKEYNASGFHAVMDTKGDMSFNLKTRYVYDFHHLIHMGDVPEYCNGNCLIIGYGIYKETAKPFAKKDVDETMDTLRAIVESLQYNK